MKTIDHLQGKGRLLGLQTFSISPVYYSQEDDQKGEAFSTSRPGSVSGDCLGLEREQRGGNRKTKGGKKGTES